MESQLHSERKDRKLTRQSSLVVVLRAVRARDADGPPGRELLTKVVDAGLVLGIDVHQPSLVDRGRSHPALAEKALDRVVRRVEAELGEVAQVVGDGGADLARAGQEGPLQYRQQ